MPPSASRAENRKGVIGMLMAMALFVGNDTLVKLATAAYPTGQVLALRGFFAILVAFGIVVATGALSDLRRIADPLVAVRAALEAIVAFTFIAALAHLPLANITAILQAASLMVVALAAITGIETVGWRRWMAVAVGFVGVLAIVRPAADGFNIYALVALLSAVLVAVRDLLTRRIQSSIPSGVVALATTSAVMVLGLAAGQFEEWRPLQLRETLYLVGAAVFVALGNLGIIIAYRSGDVSLVSAFRYTVLVFALISGVVIWQEWPDGWSLTGAALIVASGLYTLHRNRVRRSRLEAAP